MPYLLESLLFLAPFAAYGLWRWLRPAAEPPPRFVAFALLGVLCAVAGAIWYGQSRSMDRDQVYVAPRFENGQLVPGHAEPRRPDPRR